MIGKGGREGEKEGGREGGRVGEGVEMEGGREGRRVGGKEWREEEGSGEGWRERHRYILRWIEELERLCRILLVYDFNLPGTPAQSHNTHIHTYIQN